MAQLQSTKAWLDYTGSEHHCAVCQKPLHNAGALTTCVGHHMVPCWRFHYSLHLRQNPQRCQYCSQADERHELRHRKIAELVKKFGGGTDDLSTLHKTPLKPITINTPRTPVKFAGKAAVSTPNEASYNGSGRKNERRAAKQGGRALIKTDNVTTQEVCRIWRIFHPEYDREKPLYGEACIAFLRQLHALIEGYEDLNDVPMPDFTTSVNRILEALRVGPHLAIDKESKKTSQALQEQVLEDLRQFHIEMVAIAGRYRAFVRWANRSGLEVVLKWFEDRDWRTGDQIKASSELIEDSIETIDPDVEHAPTRCTFQGRVDNRHLLNRASRNLANEIRKDAEEYAAEQDDVDEEAEEEFEQTLSSDSDSGDEDEDEDEERSEDVNEPTTPESIHAKPYTKLVVYGIHPDLDEEAVARLFGKYGEVDKCEVVRDSGSGASHGYGYVTMISNDQAVAAIDALAGQPYNGRALSIEVTDAAVHDFKSLDPNAYSPCHSPTPPGLPSNSSVKRALSAVEKDAAASTPPAISPELTAELDRIEQQLEDIRKTLSNGEPKLERAAAKLKATSTKWQKRLDRVKKDIADRQGKLDQDNVAPKKPDYYRETLKFFMHANQKTYDALCDRYFPTDMYIDDVLVEMTKTMPHLLAGLKGQPGKKVEDLIIKCCEAAPEVKGIVEAAEKLFLNTKSVELAPTPHEATPVPSNISHHGEINPPSPPTAPPRNKKLLRACKNNDPGCMCGFTPYARPDYPRATDYETCHCCVNESTRKSEWVYIFVPYSGVVEGPMPRGHAERMQSIFNKGAETVMGVVLNGDDCIICDQKDYVDVSMKIYGSRRHEGPFPGFAIDKFLNGLNADKEDEIPVIVPLEVYDWLADKKGRELDVPKCLSRFYTPYSDTNGDLNEFKWLVNHAIGVASQGINATCPDHRLEPKLAFFDALESFDWSEKMPCDCSLKHTRKPVCSFCGDHKVGEVVVECEMKGCRGLKYFHLSCVPEKERVKIERPRITSVLEEEVGSLFDCRWEEGDGWRMYCPKCLESLKVMAENF